MGKYATSAKYCATCTFWTGQRKPNNGRWEVEFDDSEKGECAGGGADRSIRGARDFCYEWRQLWGASQNNFFKSTSNIPYEEDNFRQSSSGSNVNTNNKRQRMHWIYFLLIGWWFGFVVICLIVPLFIKGLVKKSFGYW